MTKEEFFDWKSDHRTKQVLHDLNNRRIEILLELGASAGYAPIEDARRAGAIRQIDDIIEMTFEEPQE